MNNKEQNNIIIRNSILSVGIKGVDYFLSFLTAPLMLACLGDYKYGIYASALSMVSWIYYFDFGIGSGMRNKVSEFLVKDDYDSAQKTISTAYLLISKVSLFIVLGAIAVLVFTNTEQVLNAYISDESLNVILFIAILIASINFVLSLVTNVMLALQKTALNNSYGIISKLAVLVSLWIFARFKINSILFVVIIEGLAQIIKNVLATLYIKKRYQNLLFRKSKIDNTYKNGILSFGIQIFIMQISALILNSTDNLMIMKLFDATQVTPYSFCYKYFSLINALFSAAISPLWSAYTVAYAKGDAAYIKSILNKSLKFYLITFIGIIVATIIFEPFMDIYVGGNLNFQNGLVFLTALYFVILIFSHIFSSLVHGISKVKYTTIACVISAVLNIPLSYFFSVCLGMELNGIILGSIVCVTISTVVYVITAIREIRILESGGMKYEVK